MNNQAQIKSTLSISIYSHDFYLLLLFLSTLIIPIYSHYFYLLLLFLSTPIISIYADYFDLFSLLRFALIAQVCLYMSHSNFLFAFKRVNLVQTVLEGLMEFYDLLRYYQNNNISNIRKGRYGEEVLSNYLWD